MSKTDASRHDDHNDRRRLKSFRSLFVAREDAHVIWRHDKILAMREALSDDVLAAHLTGKYRVGTYLINSDGRTPFLVFDVDVHEQSLVRRILRRLRKWGFRTIVITDSG
jgi:hypothetical protein